MTKTYGHNNISVGQNIRRLLLCVYGRFLGKIEEESEAMRERQRNGEEECKRMQNKFNKLPELS